jgi:hypothetical protein
VIESPVVIRAAGLAVAVAVTLAFPAGAGAFSAHGSAKQVYVTGLDAGARTTLVKAGETITRKRANKLGGLLFR